MANLPPIPQSLKPIAHFLKTAQEHGKFEKLKKHFKIQSKIMIKSNDVIFYCSEWKNYREIAMFRWTRSSCELLVPILWSSKWIEIIHKTAGRNNTLFG